MSKSDRAICIVGAGLSGCLVAWLLRSRRPELRVILFDEGRQVARARTWSFHETDVSVELAREIEPLVARRWQGHEVRFPNQTRRFSSGYRSIEPEILESRVREAGAEFRFGARVAQLRRNVVELADGSRWDADCALDARGYRGSSARLGYQKFFGQLVRFSRPHALTAPILMDAAVEQKDGYRFVYVLPWSESEALIEDTRYSRAPTIDAAECEAEIARYAHARGWEIKSVLRVESGALPIPLDEELAGPPGDPGDEIPRIGMAGGFFHPVTGYSLPDAARLADLIASAPEVTTESARSIVERYRRERRSRANFYRLLNRMMFLAAPDAERRRIFARFYRLPEATIRRFYAGETNWADRMRLLSGKPPVPLAPALRSMFSRQELA